MPRNPRPAWRGIGGRHAAESGAGIGRNTHDPKALKQMFQELWAASDSAKAFTAALKSRGFILARGDRRGHVAVDYRGEVYAVARLTGQKTKEVRKRLGENDALPSVEDAKREHASRMSEMLKRHIRDIEDRQKREAEKLAARRKEIVESQRQQRAELQKAQQTRLATETRERTRRFSRGFRGLWERITGKHTKIRKQNEQEALLAQQRDKTERDRLILRQIEERQFIHRQIKTARSAHAEQLKELQRDIAGFRDMTGKEPPKLREQFRETEKEPRQPRRERTRTREPDRER